MRSSTYFIRFFIGLTFTAMTLPVFSEEPMESYLGWDFRISAGLGQTNQPLVGASSRFTSVKPRVFIDISYYGERFFFDEDGIGFNLIEDDDKIINILGRLTDDAALFDVRRYNTDNYELADLQNRNYGFLSGFQYFVDKDWGIAELQLLTDISGTHNGQEVIAVYKYIFEHDRWLLTPSIGMRWKSKNLVNYYYGVRESEVKPDRPSYEAGSALDWVFHFESEYSISYHWNIITYLYYEKGGASIYNSPLVEDKYFSEIFAGIEYVF